MKDRLTKLLTESFSEREVFYPASDETIASVVEEIEELYRQKLSQEFHRGKAVGGPRSYG